jgi:nucleotide-binding universal stress UspA family protein
VSITLAEEVIMDRKKIVVGYDGTPSSAAALADLKRAGLPRDTDCIVVTLQGGWVSAEEERTALRDALSLHEVGNGDVAIAALATAPAPPRAHGIELMHEAIATSQEGARALQDAFPEWTVRTQVRADGAIWGLLDVVQETNADLVVVGTHERSLVGRLILGSVCQAMLRDAPCSVRIARAPVTDHPAALRVIAALDGSREAGAMLRELARRDWPAGSAVHLVSAYNPVFEAGTMYWGMSVTPDDVVDEEMQAAFAQIETARTLLGPTGVVVTQSVRLDEPVSMLLDEALRWGADTIFLGARGHRAIERALLGSVSASVARRAHCSVEVIRPWKVVEQ